MAQGQKVDREVLHRYLWLHRDRLDRIQVHQTRLSEYLGVTVVTVNRMMKELERTDRIKKVRAAKTNIGTYVVRDPKAFDPRRPNPKKMLAPWAAPVRTKSRERRVQSERRHVPSRATTYTGAATAVHSRSSGAGTF